MTLLRVLSVATLLLVTGCATRPATAPEPTQWNNHQLSIASVTDWELSAKVALRWSGGAESAGLDWSQRSDRSELALSGPFGAGAVRITREDNTLQVERGGESRIYDSSSPETLAAATGWPIPVNALPFWLRGLPDPSRSLDELVIEDGRAVEIRQGGWRISYTAYSRFGEVVLPTSMRLTRPAEAISLRLANGRWTGFP